MPGPIHFTPPPPKPDQWRVFEAYGAHDPEWKPGPMAPPSKPWVGKGKKGKKR